MRSQFQYWIFLFIVLGISNTIHAQVQIIDTLNIPTKDKNRIRELKKASREVMDKAEYKTYKKYLDTLYELAEINKLEQLKARLLAQRGTAFNKLGEYENAITDFTKALKIQDSIEFKPLDKAVTLANLCDAYNNLGDNEKIKEVASKILELQKQHQLPEILAAAAYTSLSKISISENKFEEALEFHQKVEDIGVRLKSDNIIGLANLNRAEVYLKLKEYEKALVTSQKSIEYAKKISSFEYLCVGYLHKAKALKNLGDIEAAQESLRKSIEIALEQGYKVYVMEGRLLQAEIYELKQDFKSSNNYYKLYLTSKEDYLATLSKAKRLEVEKEMLAKEEVISKQKSSINQLLLYGVPVILLLSVFLILYVKKKKKLEEDNLQILENKKILESENTSLKNKLNELALTNSKGDNEEIKIKTRKKYQNSSLSQEEKRMYATSILNYMEKEKPYLNPDLKQSDMAQHLSISIHLLSQVLNDCFKRNFNGFVNLYRINEAKRRLQDPQFLNSKIIAIGYEVGFSSKTSFHRVFKNTVGRTPSDYRDLVLNN
ncbi:helix-turn-helix domain-containing protein [Aquimarina gracilis]|uniref:Helix-turn-helix domain-containing protein n=1 Tax=Aquimarina gracilis TaxID=874422 RepID=A0ABU5ZP18_9FLAO|nr:helix-turn-helix domain-containing protein [Aquimarina gracilis]MEB3343888.1 helix-turn-helix domain-containing protein [Aquimarina gracilis]